MERLRGALLVARGSVVAVTCDTATCISGCAGDPCLGRREQSCGTCTYDVDEGVVKVILGRS